ncbi:tRNA preQ1(34) S-adenosylmethionine ribosyltransferase-isomerase QueA [Anaerovorax odorimutans]|uniref:S-adenosylmethionine:tRNA ribosyltransferase-isomerase n=1 Tax=Anaerovorax odorimutans TaxID=109327 RepID=A0ABT1RQ90_9FIRM|nr:tRNA preQ1(34) S-adenosylmethionine ribosyltransferase-isomerase QueA [Anaerovorax odorimutans]MCQ4637364.1 tRNA preQ1(34) S-adenosylmethionine ribosyltransferase-isomerase QueA [Anaerovorax odorimutans]
MNIKEFDYHLPQELIAQKPADKRDCSRLMVLHREDDTIEHRHFYDVLDYLMPGDCLVLNNSKVLPARLFGTKEETGAKVEFLLTKRLENDCWETMVKPGKRLKPGDTVAFSPDFKARITDYGTGGTRIAEFIYEGIFMERLEELGKMPLPPYIERDSDQEDKDRYQTVYCKEEGSVAAPTAGLHFTEELLKEAEEKGVKIAYVTLHVGIGTFRPVKCENIEEHQMHFEEYEISQESARLINETKAAGGRILSVGTTSTRTLESAAVLENDGYVLKAGSGNTGIFIYPGYEFKMVDGLITNFHLPKSTLLMLISALYDREKILSAYETAVKEKYRFFSYGDAMLIL